MRAANTRATSGSRGAIGETGEFAMDKDLLFIF